MHDSGRHPALLLIGHGSRSQAGVDEYWEFADALRAEAPGTDVGCGFIELSEPDLDTAIDRLVAAGAAAIAGVPLVLLGAGHAKNDGPAALARGRLRHPDVSFHYARHLGIHPSVLTVAEDRIREAIGAGDPAGTTVVVVSRGSTDPDANADLYKVGRLLQDSRGLGGVEPAFVSLARPSVREALDRCRDLGSRAVVVAPYFLFTGVLVDRIADETRAWAVEHPEVDVRVAAHLGADRRLARLTLERFHEAFEGSPAMNCDCCVYRTVLPGYDHKLGAPVVLDGHSHGHSHEHPHDDRAHRHQDPQFEEASP